MNRWTTVLVVVFIVAVSGGALALGLNGNERAASSCRGSGTPVAYTATIKDGHVSNDHITAKRCDTLTITNKDGAQRDIAFGVHDHHTTYDGITERLLGDDESFTVTLDKTGSYHWHDHFHDEVEGYFTVTQ